MVVFGQWLYLGKSGCNQESGCIPAKMVVFRQIDCILVKMVVFGQSGCIRAKIVVFGQSG